MLQSTSFCFIVFLRLNCRGDQDGSPRGGQVSIAARGTVETSMGASAPPTATLVTTEEVNEAQANDAIHDGTLYRFSHRMHALLTPSIALVNEQNFRKDC